MVAVKAYFFMTSTLTFCISTFWLNSGGNFVCFNSFWSTVSAMVDVLCGGCSFGGNATSRCCGCQHESVKLLLRLPSGSHMTRASFFSTRPFHWTHCRFVLQLLPDRQRLELTECLAPLRIRLLKDSYNLISSRRSRSSVRSAARRNPHPH